MKIWIAALIGFFLGVLVAITVHPVSQVHANTPLHLHLYEVPKGGDMTPGMLQGSQVVGLSCIAIPNQARCFVATTE
ncbi:MAG TPA: hypothetical protein VMU26_00695 [Candidatus Polarisedimenticolia bacterium]|nr:hypothetical protein [Candidatus Polarisedimenticolia bacterium]